MNGNIIEGTNQVRIWLCQAKLFNINLVIIMELQSGNMVVIDIDDYVNHTKEKWINYTLSKVNNSLVRLGIFEGEFHCHHHDNEDEFFYVISGKLLLDFEDKTIELFPNKGFTVPRGVEHRTRAYEKTVVIMVEGNTVKPEGD